MVNKSIKQLDKDIREVKKVENKAKGLILIENRRAQRFPSKVVECHQAIRTYAGEMVHARKQIARLEQSKATLRSVQSQVSQAFAMRKIEGSMRVSTGIMKDVNTLVRLPEMMGATRNLTEELMRAGLIEEMIDDAMPDNGLLQGEDEEGEEEVDKVLSEILKDKAPVAKAKEVELPAAPVEKEEETQATEELSDRLDALKS